MRLRRRLAGAKSGLDPGEYRGFAYLKGTPEFPAVLAQIRKNNPPQIRSQPAFVLKRPGLFPEGMAYAQFNGRVYAGSVHRVVVWTDASGDLHELVIAGEDGLG